MSEQPAGTSRNPIKRFQEANPIWKTIYVIGALVGVFVIVLLLSLIIGIVTGDSEDVAGIVAIVRDLFIILLAMQGMIISIALIVLILQIATLTNLLQNEISPIVKNLQDVATTLRGTSEFLSENVTTPVIQTSSFFTGVSAFMKEIVGVRKALKGNGVKQEEQE